MLHLVAPDRVDALSFVDAAQHMAVGPGHDRGIVGRLRAAFNFQTVHTRVNEIVQMVDHAHVARVHDVRALLVLEDREILARPLLLHQRVLITAGLGTFAPVAVAPRHIVGEQAAPGIADAHRPVAERLQLQLRRDLFANSKDLRQAQLPRQHDALRAQIKPALRADIVCDRLLRRDVPLAARRVFSRQRERAEIR